MKRWKRGIALALSFVMVATSVDFSSFVSSAAEENGYVQEKNEETTDTTADQAEYTESSDLKVEGVNVPSEATGETENLGETTPEEIKPGETTPEEIKPGETAPEETETEEAEPGEAEPEETQPEETPQVEVRDAFVTVAYDDVENLADRRPKEEAFLQGSFLEVYADGVKLEQPEVAYVPESDGSEHGSENGMQTDTYQISGLPRFQEDGVTETVYTVRLKQDELIGYTTGKGTDRPWAAMDYAQPSEEVRLEENEDGSISGEKTFACYLPAYKAEGTITWNPSDKKADVPSIEAYFKNEFKVLREEEAYTAVRIHYEQDADSETIWHYQVAGLFAVKEDKTPAAYVLDFGKPEGWETRTAQTVVDGTEYDGNITFTQVAEKEDVKKEEKKQSKKSVMKKAAAAETTVSAEGNGGHAEFDVTWNAIILPEPFPYVAEILYYTVNGVRKPFATISSPDGSMTITPEAIADLHLSEEQVAQIQQKCKVTDEVTGTGIQSYQITGLPDTKHQVTTDEDGNVTEATESITYDFWNGYEEGQFIKTVKSADNRTFLEYKTGNGVMLVPSVPFSVTLDMRNGDRNKVNDEDVVCAFTLTGVTNHSFVKREDGSNVIVGSDGKELPAATWYMEGDQLVIEGLPKFDENKNPVDWRISVDEVKFTERRQDDPNHNLPKEDSYTKEYDNSLVTNYGTDRDICHNGGTIKMELQGDTVYSATKVWLDEYEESLDLENTYRPDSTWELWRYSKKDGVNWQMASPVRDDNGAQITWSVDKHEEESSYTTDKYATLNGKKLPKYDTDGYEYVYFVREKMEGGGYEQVFGAVDEKTGEVTETLPEGITRVDGDTSLYNGGTLSNRHTDTVNLPQTKTWFAKAHQEELENVYVKMKLQKKAVTDGKEWVDTDVEEYLTGFTAEQLTQSISASMPKYGYLGYPIEYRWVEAGVYEGDPRENPSSKNLLQEDNTFSLSHNDKITDGKKGEEEHYESITQEDGSIVNKLVGTTSYIVKKVWEGAEGDELEDASITWTLYQNGEPYKERTMTADSGWDDIILDLPKYDENGLEYEYKAAETGMPDGWHMSSIEYNTEITEADTGITRDKNTCEMVNVKEEEPVGDGSYGKHINVRKEWVDDGDLTCRKPVQVEVWRDKYKVGEDSVQAEKLLGTVTLTVENEWRQDVDVTEYILNDGSFGTLDDWKAEHDEDEVPDETAFVADATYSLKEIGLRLEQEADGFAAPYEENPRYIANENHIYYIDYLQNGTSGAIDPITNDTYFTVTNRRVGVINIDVVKTWIDGTKDGKITDEERKELGAKLTLSCVEYPDALKDETKVVDLHDAGENALPGTRLEIKDGKQHDGADVQTVSSVQMLGQKPLDEGEETVRFYHLPKYDKDGKVVHYTVTESSKKGENGEDALKDKEYALSVSEEYTTGEQHTNDSQAFAMTNRRSGEKEVTFYKEWKDVYRFDRNQRPDIYLSLYRQNAKGEIEPTIYRDIKWAAKSEEDSDSDIDMTFSDYNWSCTFTGLPKYDENGDEIIYFATENVHIDRYTLEYIDTMYKHGDESYSSVRYDETLKKWVVENTTGEAAYNNLLYAPTVDGNEEYLLREEGTFVNALLDKVTIDGEKFWKNVPGTFDAEKDLPPLNFKVWRALEKEINSQPGSYYDDNGYPLVDNKKWEKVAWIDNFRSTSLESEFTINYRESNTPDGKPADKDGNPIEDSDRERLKEFDEYGRHYIYVITEEIVDETGDEDKTMEGAYPDQPEINGYQVINVYAPEEVRGSITVQKEWKFPDGWEEANVHYPTVKFSLYWRYTTNADEYSEISRVDIAENEKTLEYTPDTNTVTFTDLPQKAPNGSEYEYFVVESVIDGYSEAIKTDSLKAEEEVVEEMLENGFISEGQPVMGPLSPVMKKQETFAEKLRNGLKALLGMERAEDTENVFLNTYKNPQEPFAITGAKVWEDFDNKLGTRPENLTIEVWRKNSKYKEEQLLTASGWGDNGKAEVTKNENLTHPNTNEQITVVWTKDGNSRWTYTIDGLDQYAPNGELWQYKVVEVLDKDSHYDDARKDSGYVTAPTKTDVDEKLQTITMPENQSLKNQFYTQHMVKKAWDGIHTEILKLPVTMKLQVKAGENGDWTDAAKYFTGDKGIDYTIAGDTDVWEQTLTAADNWTYTWKNLPKGEGSEDSYTEYQYRAVETKVGNETVTMNDDGTSKECDTFTITSTTGNGTTTVTNTLKEDERVQLEVTKIWDDKDNQFELRPMNGENWTVSFEIWKVAKGQETDIATAGEPVLKTDGKATLTVTVTGGKTENQVYAEVKNLPKRTLNEDGSTFTEWTYYAKEIKPDDTALNGGYDATEKPIDGETPSFASEATNELITTEISGKKVWNDENNAYNTRPDNITLTLQLSVDSGKTWVDASTKTGYDKIQPTWEEQAIGNEWTWKYSGLPVTDNQGRQVKYRVLEKTRSDGYWDAEYSDTATPGTPETPETPDYLDNDTITNTMTAFTLNKDGALGTIEDVSLTFTGTGAVADWKLIWTRVGNVEHYEIQNKDVKHHEDSATKAGERVVIKGLPVGTYTLTDEVLPNGYETAANKENSFTLNGNGTVSVSKAGANMTVTGDKEIGFAVTVTDTPQALNLTKTDLGGNSLTGAVFTVTGQFRATDKTLTAENTVREIGGTEGEQLKPGDLVAGQSYVLKETKAPAGYILSVVEVTFTMDAYGNVTITSPTGNSPATAREDTITFEDAPINAVLKKMDKGTPVTELPGAVFEVTGKFADTPTGQATSTITVNDTNRDTALLAKLIGGEIYTIVEKNAPLGYQKPESAASFTMEVAKNGTLTVEAVGGVALNGATIEVTDKDVLIHDEPINITLVKKDGDAPSGQPVILAGVSFTLTDKATDNPQAQQTATTDEQGKLYIGTGDNGGHSFAVYAGKTYSLTETAPTGYTGIESTDITVNNNGTVTFTEVNSTGDTKVPEITGNSTAEITVTNRRKTGSLEIEKVDLNDNTVKLEGAVFELYRDNVPGEEKDTLAAKLITDADGKAMVSGLKWGTYKLKEVTPPTGYILNPAEMSVEITKDNLDVKLVSATAITNQKNSLTIQKKNEDSSQSLKAGFELYQKKGDEWTKVTTFPATVTDVISLAGLAEGTYRLVEVIPPEGYKVPTETEDRAFIFTMNNEGKITAEKHGFFTYENGTPEQGSLVYPNTITMKDEPIQAVIQKVDENGEPLPGATFAVTGRFTSTPDEKESDTITVTDENREEALLAQLIYGESYQITEVDAPLGYQKPEGDVHFTMTVGIDGTLEVAESNGATLNGTTISVDTQNGENVWIQDTPIAITLRKLDGDVQDNDREEMAGVTFTLEDTETQEVQTAQTDADGELHLGTTNSANGFAVYAERTYILKETETLDGYLIGLGEDGIELRVNADGTVTFAEIAGVITGSSTAEKPSSTITVTNRRKTGTLILTKKDSQYTEETEDDTSLNGITFSLYKKKDGNWLENIIDFITGKKYTLTESFVWGDETTYPDGVTAEDGQLIVEGLTWGDYKIVESRADGYVLDASEHTFTVGPDGEMQTYLEVALGTIINDPNYVAVQKVDAEDQKKLLQGAEFTLTDASGMEVAENQWTWNSKTGEGRAYRLAPGIYTLRETKAPLGYEKFEDVQFEMKPDGTISLVGEPEQAELMGEGTVGLILKDEQIVVHIGKRFLGDQAEHFASGAEFVLKGRFSDGTEEYKFTSAKIAEELKGLLVGGETYTLTETVAPDGAAAAEGEAFTFTFKVEEDGTITGLSGDDTAETITATYEEDNDCITVWNEPITLRILKKGSDSGENLLAGATYAISGRFAEDRYHDSKDGSAGLHTLTVSAEPNGTLDNALKGRLIIGETYKIQELTAPGGYKIAAPIRVTVENAVVTEAGIVRTELTLSSEEAGFEVAEDKDGRIVLIQTDEPTDMKLRKVDAGGKGLANAEFTLTGIFGDHAQTETITVRSDKDGYIDLAKQINESNLAADSEYVYSLKEVKAPEGFEKLAEPIYFRLATKTVNGRQTAKIEMLYGTGKTPHTYQRYLKAEKNVLNIINMPVKPKTVKTGDASPITGWFICIGAAAVMVILALIWRRKNKK